MRGDLVLPGEVERLLQILKGADDGAANGDPLQHRLEDRQRKAAGRQAHHGHGSLRSQHPESLLEALRRDGGDQDAVRTANLLLQFVGRIGVTVQISTAATCIPIALAYWTAMPPSPPMLEMTAHSPGLTSVSFSPLWTVTPAHSTGAAAPNSSLPGR